MTTTRLDEQSSNPPRTSGVVAPRVLRELLAGTGIRFNGDRPWDIQVLDGSLFRRVLTKGSLGFGEAYMDGLWDAYAMDECFSRLLSRDIEQKIGHETRLRLLVEVIRQSLLNPQTKRRAFQVGEQHYDIGNDVFEVMLDPTMSYSCGYWQNADALNQAQLAKLDLVCRKLELKPGERLLEIGCGWGGLAKYAAEHYGVHVHGITVSKEQRRLAQERCRGLPVTIELIDYRDLRGTFDKVASIGMFEHVGPRNYAVYLDTVLRLLADQGLFLLHTIGTYRTQSYTDPWIEKYIFPNGKLPSARQLTNAIEARFLIEDWHNFGPDYDRTLMAWWHNFDAAWPTLERKYGERFRRMWKYYLMSCAGFFRSRQGQLWQLVLSKRQRIPIYRSVR